MGEGETQPYFGYIDDIRRIEKVIGGFDDGEIPGAEVSESKITGVVYFASIGERVDPKYRWEPNTDFDEWIGKIGGLTPGLFPSFAISFPHVTQVFSWGDSSVPDLSETNYYRVGIFDTQTLKQKQPPKFQFSSYDEGPNPEPSPTLEFMACPLEALIIAREVKAWAGSDTDGEYFSWPRYKNLNVRVRNPNKLRDRFI